MVAVLASCVAGGTLLLAALSKGLDRAGSAVALGTYGIGARWAPPALVALIALETVLGAAVLGGAPGAAWAAGALFAAFALLQAVLLARGGRGAPCGCLGGRGRLSAASAARAAGLAGLAFLAGTADGGAWWAPAATIAAVVALAAFGRRAPDGALDVAGEGPDVGARVDLPRGVLLFTSGGCRLCARVRRGLRGFDVTELDEERDAHAWHAARVPGAPYAVVVDEQGVVRAKGTVNTGAQVRALTGISRRGFLERAAGAAAALAAADTVGRLVRPGEAEAYHFCGHIYTTDSCPHPTGLPRIDAKGLPLRATDGHPVDDLGRLIDAEGAPIGEDGVPLADADGRPLPPAPRTAVCKAVAQDFGFRTRVDGAWYRCCGGRVRKLVDCCSEHRTRINGDKALRGYCYGHRKVFCVMYYQTKVPC
jgi:hypothetical protein